MVATLGLLAASLRAAPAPDWTKVKVGMNSEEAVKELGEPLIRTYGRGIEVWIYDGRGEALFTGGPLKSWTAGSPTPESIARPASDDVLIRPVRRLPLRLAPIAALPARIEEPADGTRFRYRPR